MRTFIANFGRHNYLWPLCYERGSIATIEAEDLWPLRLAGDREAYIDLCVGTQLTAKGIAPTRPVASGWFNLPGVISATEADLWIHREKTDLWWTVSRAGEVKVSLQPAHDPRTPGDRVYVIEKSADPWSNVAKNGRRLEWAGLHAKAREFLFTELTLQKLSPDNAEYAVALIHGHDLRPWHERRDWQVKAEAARRNPATTYNAEERAIIRMAATARDTVRASNGQQVLRTVKNKEFRFSSNVLFEEYIAALLKSQEGLCAITGIRLQFDGDHDDPEMLCSLDRIDSNGHYEAGNLQVVCQFVNRWKSDSQDASFRRLVGIVRSTAETDW